jgi:hypothetical protein
MGSGVTVDVGWVYCRSSCGCGGFAGVVSTVGSGLVAEEEIVARFISDLFRRGQGCAWLIRAVCTLPLFAPCSGSRRSFPAAVECLRR